jgi:hypothetical protein
MRSGAFKAGFRSGKGVATQELMNTLGRRSAQRICLRVDVGILDEKSGKRSLGQLVDLSASGACVKTTQPLAIGEEVRLAFEYEPGAAPVRLHAEVVWSSKDHHSKATAYFGGMRFLDLAGSDFGRLRGFIDRKLWSVQKFLSSFELLNDLNDLEKVLLSSVSFDRDILINEILEFANNDDTLVLVRSGKLVVLETDPAGRELPPREVGPGEFCGSLPIDPRGGMRIKLRAKIPSSVLCIPNDGFWYLWSTHAATALKILSCWTLSLRDRVLAIEPIAPPK